MHWPPETRMSALQIWPDSETEEIGSASGYNNRHNTRNNSPILAAQIRGRTYQTLNWSLSGLLVGDYDCVLSVGDTFEIDQIGRAGKTSWPVMIQARVLRTGGQSGMELAAQFLTISAPAFDILEGILLRRPNFRSAV